jgi:tetratricopeptide (TPR) repeat protein
MSVRVSLTVRGAVGLAAIALAYLFIERDDEQVVDDANSSAPEFVRDVQQINTAAEQSHDPSPSEDGDDSLVTELHQQALAALNEQSYQLAFELAQEIYLIDDSPSNAIAVNASRIAGYWANDLQSHYRPNSALLVWRQAIEWHHDTGHPQLSLARLLLRGAKVAEALVIVEEALVEFPDNSKLLALRADIASLQGEADLAVKFLSAALAIDSANSYYATRLEQLKIEALAFTDYLSVSTAHFESSFDSQNRSMVRNIDDLQQDLERAWSDISGILGIQNDIQIVVLWLDKKDYQVQAPDWSAGIYDGRIRIVVDDYPERRPQLLATLKHELTHALLHSTGIQFPTFLQEGLAQLYEPRDVDAIREAYLLEDIPSLIDLQGAWTTWTDTDRVRSAYAYSVSLCDFTRERYGENSFRLLFDNMRHSNLKAAWAATFGDTLDDTDALHRKLLLQDN